MKIQQTGINTVQADSLPRPSDHIQKTGFGRTFADALSKTDGQVPGNGLMEIGTITRDTPTISQLLYKSPLKSKCWNIIYDKANADKPFNKIRTGTKIAYNPATKELLWGNDLKAFIAEKKQAPDKLTWSRGTGENLPRDPVAPATPDLSHAVRQFIGKDYEAMDCYELVVGGLKELGVQYKGQGGLGRHLVNQALSKGLPENHYLNGEGLVSESGRPVFKKTLYTVGNPQTQAAALMEEMTQVLKEGQVLSFSMRNRGHTGVVSKAQDQWTFINSGDMDHNIDGKNGTKQVGEEDLKSELENWLAMAREAGLGLRITLGDLNIDRLSMFKAKGFSKSIIRSIGDRIKRIETAIFFKIAGNEPDSKRGPRP